MNCQQAQSQIAQLADGRPAADLVAHARGCAACRRALEEALQQQAWLRQQFAEASAHLLAEAPAFSESRLRERAEQSQPVVNAPWLWATGLAAATVVIGLGVWHFSSARTAPPQAAKTNLSAETQSNPIAGATPHATNLAAHKTSTPGANTNRTARDASAMALAQARRAAALAKRAPRRSQPETNATASSLPPMENRLATAAVPLPAGPEAESYAMAATAILPAATGHVVVLDPDGPEGVEPLTMELSLNGLEPNATYNITGKTLGGQLITLASVTTDANGSASASLPAAKTGSSSAGAAPPPTAGAMVAANANANTAGVTAPHPAMMMTFADATGQAATVTVDATEVRDASGNVVLNIAPQRNQ